MILESKREPHILHYKIFQSDDRDCMFRGFKHWDVSKSDTYRQVCTVDWFGGMTMEGHDWYVDDKEEVFRILNGITWMKIRVKMMSFYFTYLDSVKRAVLEKTVVHGSVEICVHYQSVIS